MGAKRVSLFILFIFCFSSLYSEVVETFKEKSLLLQLDLSKKIITCEYQLVFQTNVNPQLAFISVYSNYFIYGKTTEETNITLVTSYEMQEGIYTLKVDVSNLIGKNMPVTIVLSRYMEEEEISNLLNGFDVITVNSFRIPLLYSRDPSFTLRLEITVPTDSQLIPVTTLELDRFFVEDKNTYYYYAGQSGNIGKDFVIILGRFEKFSMKYDTNYINIYYPKGMLDAFSTIKTYIKLGYEYLKKKLRIDYPIKELNIVYVPLSSKNYASGTEILAGDFFRSTIILYNNSPETMFAFYEFGEVMKIFTLYHEFLHGLFPYTTRENIYFIEGIIQSLALDIINYAFETEEISNAFLKLFRVICLKLGNIKETEISNRYISYFYYPWIFKYISWLSGTQSFYTFVRTLYLTKNWKGDRTTLERIFQKSFGELGKDYIKMFYSQKISIPDFYLERVSDSSIKIVAENLEFPMWLSYNVIFYDGEQRSDLILITPQGDISYKTVKFEKNVKDFYINVDKVFLEEKENNNSLTLAKPFGDSYKEVEDIIRKLSSPTNIITLGMEGIVDKNKIIELYGQQWININTLWEFLQKTYRKYYLEVDSIFSLYNITYAVIKLYDEKDTLDDIFIIGFRYRDIDTLEVIGVLRLR